MTIMCANCRYSDDLGDSESPLVLCRRFPPTAVDDSMTEAPFPFVDVESWCGEYKRGMKQ